MKLYIVKSLVMVSVISLASCKSDKKEANKDSEATISDIQNASKINNSDIVRNPVTADTPIDPNMVPKMTFEKDNYDFGKIKEGDVVEHIFKFTNDGKAPLIISNASASCGCTVPEWPKEPVAPGKSGEIKVKFNSAHKKGDQEKKVTITANTYPSTSTVVVIKGYVEPSPEGDKEKDKDHVKPNGK